jgi:uncharacterized protein (TIGR02145 family)
MKQLNKLMLLGILVILCLNSNSNAQTVMDYEGNVYKTVTIGTQIWTSQNIKSKKYSDGSDVDTLLIKPCNNDANTIDSLGYLYTWDAVMKNSTVEGAQGICPNGWHVPSVADYNVLINYLGGAFIAGRKMKSVNTTFWDSVTLADNTSGFNAHGGGWIAQAGISFWYKGATMFWVSNEDGANARIVQLNSNSEIASNLYGSNRNTFVSCRCVSNTGTGFNDLNKNNELNVYPNPTNGIINFDIKTLKSRSLDLIIYNSLGQAVVNKCLENGTIDMKSYSNGLYLYCIKSDGKTIYRGKFYKE